MQSKVKDGWVASLGSCSSKSGQVVSNPIWDKGYYVNAEKIVDL